MPKMLPYKGGFRSLYILGWWTTVLSSHPLIWRCDDKTPPQNTSVPSRTLSAHCETLRLKRKCLPGGHWCRLQMLRPPYQFLQIIPSLSFTQRISWGKRQGKHISKPFSPLNLFQALLHGISHVRSPLPSAASSWISGRCDDISTKSAEHPAISCTRQSTCGAIPIWPLSNWALQQGPLRVTKGDSGAVLGKCVTGVSSCCF